MTEIEELIEKTDWHQLLSERQEYNPNFDKYKTKQFSESFLKYFSDKFDIECWKLICSYQKLSESFIEDHLEIFDDECWDNICFSQNLSEDFIRKHSKNISLWGWSSISRKQNLTSEFILEFQELLCNEDSEGLAKNPNLINCNLDLIKHLLKDYWYYVLKDCNDNDFKFKVLDKYIDPNLDDIKDLICGVRLPELLIIKWFDILIKRGFIKLIIKYQDIPTFLIVKYKDFFNIVDVLASQDNLDLDLIQANFELDYIAWKNISRFQKLSSDFIKTNINFLHKEELLKNYKINKTMVLNIYEAYSDLM